MIARIEVVNFQSIGHAEILCGPWVSIVGESDVGKSAIVRALYALLTNQRGDHFIRHGAKSCTVTVMLDSGLAIEWGKSRGASGTYRVRTPNGNGGTYEKTNGTVPDEVRDLLRMSMPVAGEDFMPGVQRQFDPPFLLADTARRRAQVLGEFDGTNILLTADGIVRRAQRIDQAYATAQRATASEADAGALALAWVDDAQLAVQAAQAAHGAAERAQVALDAAVAFRFTLRAHQDGALDAEAWAAACEPPAVDVPAMVAALHRIGLMRDTLDQYAAAVRTVRESEVAAQVAIPDIDAVANAGVALAALRLMRSEYASATERVRLAERDTRQAAAERAAAAKALSDLAGALCPVCGQPLTAEALTV